MPNAAGKLVVVPTPIGNLGDVTVRSLEALRAADVVYAEDTRVTGKLLRALDVSAASVVRLDENTLAERASDVVARIAAGDVCAYCTDAGMPGVSDPGLRLVRAVRDAGQAVEVLPGASAAATAYVASGTVCPRYYFGGFFPRKAAERTALLNELRALDAALVFYESPHRLASALEAIARAFPHRAVAVCRELTKLHEEVVRGGADDVAQEFARRAEGDGEPVKGEIAVVIDAPAEQERTQVAADATCAARLHAAELAEGGATQKTIAKALASEFGIPRNEAYAIALAARGAAQGVAQGPGQTMRGA